MLLARICNKLFGWEYVIFSHGYSRILRRVHVFKDGCYVNAYGDWFKVGVDRDYKRDWILVF